MSLVDTNWLKKSYPGFWIETHRWYGYGDFNKDGLRYLVVMFATNAPANINHQKDILGIISNIPLLIIMLRETLRS